MPSIVLSNSTDSLNNSRSTDSKIISDSFPKSRPQTQMNSITQNNWTHTTTDNLQFSAHENETDTESTVIRRSTQHSSINSPEVIETNSCSNSQSRTDSDDVNRRSSESVVDDDFAAKRPHTANITKAVKAHRQMQQQSTSETSQPQIAESAKTSVSHYSVGKTIGQG